MENLFELEVEKYWDFTKKYTKEQKETEIQNRISSDDYIASIKMDGHYNRFVKFNNESRMLSRTISTVTGTYGNKSELVPHIFQTLKTLPNNTVIIGELYYPNTDSSYAGEILQCKPEKAIKRQNDDYGLMYYYIHDIWFFNGEDLRKTPYEKRIKILENIYNEYLKNNNYIKKANYATTPKDIKELLSFARENDEEGIVMVRKDAIVECGARTAWKTIKVKKELEKEIDCFFTGGYRPPVEVYSGEGIENWTYWKNLKDEKLLFGKYFKDYDNGETLQPVTKSYFYNWAGSAEIGIIKNGKIEILGYVSGLTDEIKEELVSTDKYKMKACTVTGMNFTADNKIRHPKFVRFRDDLNIEDCNWGKIFGEEN